MLTTFLFCIPVWFVYINIRNLLDDFIRGLVDDLHDRLPRVLVDAEVQRVANGTHEIVHAVDGRLQVLRCDRHIAGR